MLNAKQFRFTLVLLLKFIAQTQKCDKNVKMCCKSVINFDKIIAKVWKSALVENSKTFNGA